MTRDNRTYDEIRIGDEASIRRLCTADDLFAFAQTSGNFNPINLPAEGDGEAAAVDMVAPSMWVGSLISAVLGNVLPGPGTLYLAQSLRFHGRCRPGDTLIVSAVVTAKRPGRVVLLDTAVTLVDGTRVASGEAEVIAPEVRISVIGGHVPGVVVERHRHFSRLIDEAARLPTLVTAVIAPEDDKSLGGALLAAGRGLIRPLLIGGAARIHAAAKALGADLAGHEIIDIADADKAAAFAVECVRQGRAGALMKGSLHTDVMLHHVVKGDGGLRTGRRLSHVFVMDVPGVDHLLMVTDAAINIAPSLEEKVDIIQNAIDLAHALGLSLPKVGVLSAIETVSSKIPSTIDAAILSKMAERGQITGGIVDGPLAMDNAIDLDAARTKGITSLVAGRADILVVPNLEAGNMLAKELTYLAHAEGGGIVLGASVPVILTSRSDSDTARLASCAVAVLYDAWKRGMLAPALKAAAE